MVIIMFDLIKKLCLASAPSGLEDEAREIIKGEITGYADEIRVNKTGCILAFKKGKSSEKNHDVGAYGRGRLYDKIYRRGRQTVFRHCRRR